MGYKINVQRHIFLVIVFLVSILFLPAAYAKHIIVVYDVSGSMISDESNMEPGDIRRVNDYLTGLLFTEVSQSLRDNNDTYIQECEAAFVGKPLYQSGDVLTYVEYAKRGNIKVNRSRVSRDEFQRQLPISDFPGMVSYLLSAEVEVYDELYRKDDDETYWVFVTDGNNSWRNDPDIATVLKRHAAIEEEFYSPLTLSLFVNNYVKIEVRRLQKRDDIKSIFISTPIKPKEPVRKIQLSRDMEKQFFSETLTINTENSEKTKFKLNSVGVEVVDKHNRPLQIVTQDNRVGVLEVSPILLSENSPPYEFQILLSAHPEIAAPGNALKLEVVYNYDGEDEVYSAPLMNYTAVIDSIYVATLEEPDHPAKKLDLVFSEGRYSEALTIQSESPNIDAFQINEIRCQIQDRYAGKLFDAAVPQRIKRLDESFNLEVPKGSRLDWYGNKIVFGIDYQYEGDIKSTTIQIPFKVRGGGIGFPMWLLWILIAIPLVGLVLLLIRQIKPIIFPPLPVYHIALTEVSEGGTELGVTKYFIFKDKDTLEFGARGSNESCFDVGSEAFLYCNKTDIILFTDADDEEGQILDLPETITLSRSEDDKVRVYCEIVDDISDESEEEQPIIDANPSNDDPLGV